MTTATKARMISMRMTKPEKENLESTAKLHGQKPGPLAEVYVRAGGRRTRFPAVDFRDEMSGGVACRTDTR